MVKCPGVIGWKANARPPGWKVWENAPLLPGGGWALLELTDALPLRMEFRPQQRHIPCTPKDAILLWHNSQDSQGNNVDHRKGSLEWTNGMEAGIAKDSIRVRAGGKGKREDRSQLWNKFTSRLTNMNCLKWYRDSSKRVSFSLVSPRARVSRLRRSHATRVRRGISDFRAKKRLLAVYL